MSNSQLLGILKEAREMKREDRRRPLLDCPTCGEALEFRDGIANCPLGHYRTRRQTVDPAVS